MSRTTLAPVTSRTASWIGGVGLLLIAILAGFGNFGALAPLITTGDAAATAQAISSSELLFRIGVLCMLLAAILDVVVAAALYAITEAVNRLVAITAAWFRVAYSAVFLVAIGVLAVVPSLVDQPELAMTAIDTYLVVWRTGLVLFAVHLLLIGYLGFRSGLMPKLLAIAVAIAGIGYFIDGVATVVVADYSPTVSTFTFVGEVALIVWLIVVAVRPSKPAVATAI